MDSTLPVFPTLGKNNPSLEHIPAYFTTICWLMTVDKRLAIVSHLLPQFYGNPSEIESDTLLTPHPKNGGLFSQRHARALWSCTFRINPSPFGSFWNGNGTNTSLSEAPPRPAIMWKDRLRQWWVESLHVLRKGT